jgi:hypothetical protein
VLKPAELRAAFKLLSIGIVLFVFRMLFKR